MNFSALLAFGIIKKKPNTSSCGEGGVTLLSWYCREGLPQSLLIHSIPECGLCVGLPGRAVLLPQGVFDINKLLSVSLPSVRGGVFSHPITLGWELILTQEINGWQLKHTSLCVFRTDNLLGFPQALPSDVNFLSIPSSLHVHFLCLPKSLHGAPALFQSGWVHYSVGSATIIFLSFCMSENVVILTCTW